MNLVYCPNCKKNVPFSEKCYNCGYDIYNYVIGEEKKNQEKKNMLEANIKHDIKEPTIKVVAEQTKVSNADKLKSAREEFINSMFKNYNRSSVRYINLSELGSFVDGERSSGYYFDLKKDDNNNVSAFEGHHIARGDLLYKQLKKYISYNQVFCNILGRTKIVIKCSDYFVYKNYIYDKEYDTGDNIPSSGFFNKQVEVGGITYNFHSTGRVTYKIFTEYDYPYKIVDGILIIPFSDGSSKKMLIHDGKINDHVYFDEAKEKEIMTKLGLNTFYIDSEQYKRSIQQRDAEKRRDERAKQHGDAPWDVRYYKHSCPYCGEYTVRPVAWDDYALSLAFWGFFSKKVHDKYKCDSCKKSWR